MPDRDDDDERGAPAVGLGATGGAEAGHGGQPGAGHPAGQSGGGHLGGGHVAQPGGGHTGGKPDGGQALSQPGGGHAAGQPGSVQSMAQPGGGHAAAPPVAQPGAGQAGQPAAQPGTGYPGQPSAARPGATSFISIKGILIAAAAIVAIVIAIVAAFFMLRPNPPQQTAEQQSPTTAANLPRGAPTPESSTGWSGEYQVTSYEKIRDTFGGCEYSQFDPISVSVTGATINLWGGMTGTMTTDDSFTATQSTSVMDYIAEGSFARTGDVATLTMTYTYSYTDPINGGNACVYRYTATHRG